MRPGREPLMDRRQFVQTGAGAALATALAPTSPGNPAPRRLQRIGVQLYTVRAEMGRSVERTLDAVAGIGYKEVQFAGYFGRTPRQIRTALDASGLVAPGAHIPLSALRDGWDATLDAARVMGHRYLLVAWIDPAERRTLDGYRNVARLFNRAAELAGPAGVLFAYHNHDYEFTSLEGRRPYDVLLAEASPDLVKMEMDLFWITHGGGDPFAYFRAYPGRFHSVHIKDMDRKGRMVDVGRGTINFARILAQQDQAGIRHCFVEHDTPERPLDSIRDSYNYLRSLEF